MARKSSKTEKIYINERFEEQLGRMESFPLTVLEAPMGYGKTACLREYLNHGSTRHIWMTAVHGSRSYFWEKFCGAVSGIDEEAGRFLREIGFPETEEWMYRAADRIGAIGLSEETLLVIDDYHLVTDEALERFFAAAAEVHTPGLHIILAGRKKFRYRREELALKKHMLIIGAEDLRMEPKDIRKYYSICGMDLRYRQAARLYSKSGGWPAALYLNMKEGNRFDGNRMPGRVYELLEQSVVPYFNQEETDILQRVSVFRSFSMEQARFIRRKQDPRRVLLALEEKCGFLVRDPDTDRMELNPLLIDYYRSMLDRGDARYRSEVFRNAADWYLLNREYGKAAYAYFRSGHFEEMLNAFERDGGSSLSGSDVPVMLRICAACPASLRRQHPYAAVILGRHLSMAEEKETLDKLLAFMNDYAEDLSITEEERKRFLAERKLMEGFLSYKEPEKMLTAQAEAEKLTDGSCTVRRNSISAFGSPSYLYLMYSRPGQLKETIDLYKQGREAYYRITDNNTRGSEFLLEAEGEFYRGNMNTADILTGKALNVGARYQQKEVQINALFLHMRIAMLTGATEEGAAAMRTIRELAAGSRLLQASSEMGEAWIYAVFNQLNPIASWIAEGRFIYDEVPGVYPVVRDYLNIIYGKILLDQMYYTKYLGISMIMMEEAERSGHLLPKIYLQIFDAIAYRKINMPERSEAAMRKAVRLAARDHLIVPFAENGGAAANILKTISFDENEKEFAEECTRFTEKYERNLNVLLREAGISPLSLLTRREQEISLLVAEGKTNLQIAKELNIAEITVKKSLSNIYARLGVSNRTSLLNKIK